MSSTSELAKPAASATMPATLRRVAIVPARNEEGAIGGVVREIRAFDPGLDVVVIDDGSTDRTAAVAAAAGAHVVRLPFNLGIGGAVQTGFRYALAHGFELAVRLDGDGQHEAYELAKVIEPILAGEADIVVGSRFAARDGHYKGPLPRRVGIRDRKSTRLNSSHVAISYAVF